MSKVELTNLPSTLYEKIKNQGNIDISKMTQKALNLSYGAFMKRAKEDRLLFYEVSKVATYCGYKVTVTIDDQTFENQKIEDPQAGYGKQNTSQKELYKIIELTETNGALQLDNQRLTYENAALKKELEDCRRGNG